MEIKMKTISNLASFLALTIVLTTYVFCLTGNNGIAMEDALRTALFIKGSFLQIDISCWIKAFREQ